ncbi:MAG: carbohydrate kinase family protein [Patescibacteria group bacterium]
MFDVITIGSATRDLFIQSKAFKIIKTPRFRTGRALAVSLGSKCDIEELKFFVGGGAVNTATTFANQGFHAAALCVIGKQGGSEEVLDFLGEKRISSKFVFRDSHDRTAYSLIFTVPGKDRTVLRYEGVTWHLHEFPIPWQELSETKWFYLNHLGGKSTVLVPQLISLAREHGIRIAWNPGRTQLENPKKLFTLLKHVEVFIVNQEEACILTGIPYENKKEIFRRLDDLIHGIVIMTKGSKGVEVSDGKTIWSAGVVPLKKIIDRTGAGDAFGSGFVVAFMRKPGDIEYAIQFASANATSVLTQWGATNGLLKKEDSMYQWGRLNIKKNAL